MIRTLTTLGKSSFTYTLLLFSLCIGYYQFYIVAYIYDVFNYGYIFIYHKYYVFLFSIISISVIINVFKNRKYLNFILFLISLLLNYYIYLLAFIISFYERDLKKSSIGHLTLLLLLFIFSYTINNNESKALEIAMQDINIINTYDLENIDNIIFVDNRNIKICEENTFLHKRQEKIIDIDSILSSEFKNDTNYIFFCDGVVCGETLHKIAVLKTKHSFNAYYLLGGIK